MTTETPIIYLKGVGPAKATLLGRELNISTVNDLLMHFPFRYIDRTKLDTVATITATTGYVVLRGIITHPRTSSSGRSLRLNAIFTDATGSLELVWFQRVDWIKDTLPIGKTCLLMGKPSLYNGIFSIAHPEIEPIKTDGTPQQQHPFIPVYATTEKLRAAGLASRGLTRLVETCLNALTDDSIAENIPDYVLSQYHLPSHAWALRNIHFPQSYNDITQATTRMKFDELFFLQLDYQFAKVRHHAHSVGRVFSTIGNYFNRFYREKLPFELTHAQKRVVKEIRNDMRTGHQMNRLLQGDVGSGKTLVALLSMLIALDNGCQACLLAPTEILATQHYNTISHMVNGLDIHVDLLSGALKAKEKRQAKQRLLSGETHIIIGTHALLEDDVQFAQLGLVVIDEQHRFGVEQRSRLWTKSNPAPHILVMTATPIPRTLAMTLYGDLECSVIDELPPGRKQIKTIHATEAKRLAVYGFLRRQISEGRQVYVVYPLIEESEKRDLMDLMNGYDDLQIHFPMPQYQISIVHGRMPADAKAYEMDRFKKGITHIMVSTTVIEVGVDIPNASVMMIENAERFGLSQLHQLRGRVGRGCNQSYCILMTKNNLSTTAAERIQTMVSSNDGFVIAEADLKLRGPGDMQGLQQSGLLNLHIADIVNDEPLVRATRNMVQNILAHDPTLMHPLNRCLLNYITDKHAGIDWGSIS